MKLCDVPYEEAVKRHPDQVRAIVERLRRGKSKHRGVEPSALVWSYQTAVRVQGFSFGDFLSGKLAEERAVLEARPLDERVADEEGRTSTLLLATLGRWWGNEPVPNPPEVAVRVRERLVAEAKEREKFAAMPREEKERAVGEAVRDLSRGGGFVAMRVPGRPINPIRDAKMAEAFSRGDVAGARAIFEGYAEGSKKP